MKRLRTIVLFVVTIGVLATSGFFVSGRSSGSAAQDVKVVNMPTEPVPVAIQGPNNVSISNLPANFFTTNNQYRFVFVEGSGVANVVCTVSEIRGYWLKCSGQVRRANGQTQAFNTWLNANFILTVN